MATQLETIFDAGTVPILNAVANFAALDALSEQFLKDGSLCLTKDTKNVYRWDTVGGAWVLHYGTAEVTWSGGAATLNAPFTGATTAHKVQATIKVKGTPPTFQVLADITTADQVALELPGANTGNNTQVTVTVSE